VYLSEKGLVRSVPICHSEWQPSCRCLLPLKHFYAGAPSLTSLSYLAGSLQPESSINPGPQVCEGDSFSIMQIRCEERPDGANWVETHQTRSPHYRMSLMLWVRVKYLTCFTVLFFKGTDTSSAAYLKLQYISADWLLGCSIQSGFGQHKEIAG
jgi:hypothetical protein